MPVSFELQFATQSKSACMNKIVLTDQRTVERVTGRLVIIGVGVSRNLNGKEKAKIGV